MKNSFKNFLESSEVQNLDEATEKEYLDVVEYLRTMEQKLNELDKTFGF